MRRTEKYTLYPLAFVGAITAIIVFGGLLLTAYERYVNPSTADVLICLPSHLDGSTILLKPKSFLRVTKAKIADTKGVAFNNIEWGNWRVFIRDDYWREINVNAHVVGVNCVPQDKQLLPEKYRQH